MVFIESWSLYTDANTYGYIILGDTGSVVSFNIHKLYNYITVILLLSLYFSICLFLSPSFVSFTLSLSLSVNSDSFVSDDTDGISPQTEGRIIMCG